jgi:hypothetical protein
VKLLHLLLQRFNLCIVAAKVVVNVRGFHDVAVCGIGSILHGVFD